MVISLKTLLLSANPVQQLEQLIVEHKLENLEPTLAALEMKIPKGYNHKNNLTHSLQVLQNAVDRETGGPDLILRTAALFHDIGKPDTREFHENKTVSFTNHDVVGAKIVKQILPKHGYGKEEIKEIAQLVFMHMRSHTFKTGWTESAVRRLTTHAGSETQLDRLIILFYSDATTKHDDKKNVIHKNVTELAEAVTKVKTKDLRATLRPALNGNQIAELFNLQPGPELGKIMKLLNKDENVGLTEKETISLITETLKQN